jgi:1,2-diacylglycerol 3-alpha-glucosyltransferase
MLNKPQLLSQVDSTQFKDVHYIFTDIDDTLTTDGKLTAGSFSMLWKLKEAGFEVIPVTGRPAGWCDCIIRQWPVNGIVGENGAFYLKEEPDGVRRFLHPNVPAQAQKKLQQLQSALQQKYKSLRIASDQDYRLFDLAIDFAEDEPKLDLSYAYEIADFCTQFGAVSKVSSIHVNSWFGKYTKDSMVTYLMEELLEVDEWKHRSIFIGDSPNDEPMFRLLDLSCAVKNIEPFLPSLEFQPQFITENQGGEGFCELGNVLLQAASKLS